MAIKKIPLRRCNGCNESKPKKELVRVVKSPDGEISLDLIGKKAGRGAYVCKNAACLAKAIKSRRIERALECAIPDEIYEAMNLEISKAEAE
ncbi:MAG: YlxR family protein [Oscillospiraceae bacterium]